MCLANNSESLKLLAKNHSIQQSQNISMNCLQKTAMHKDIKYELNVKDVAFFIKLVVYQWSIL